ncbi:MAG: CbtA family protein [Rhodospirillaceae bacterium]|nr:CbtA family protein [Rhodospirillaceae bacterium]
MTKRLFPAVLIAGIAGGIIVSILQAILLAPLMDFAEFLEMGARPEDYVAPKGIFALALSNPEMTLNTFAFDALGGVSFALIIGAAMVFQNRAISLKTGFIWGLFGWFAFSLAPALGQPPALPGSAYIDLEARQLWWWLCVASTSVGIVLLVFIGDWAGECGIKAGIRNGWWPKVVGAVLVLLPHILGAPESAQQDSNIPAHLSRDFALYSLISTFVFWQTIGGALGFMLGREGKNKI